MSKSRPLGLHQITAAEVDPVELVRIAATLGCEEVCVFTNLPRLDPDVDPLENPAFQFVGQHNLVAFKAALVQHRVRVANIEFFTITPDLDLETYRSGLELGAELGARCAVTHNYEPDADKAVTQLSRLAGMAADCGLNLALEFMGLSPCCNSIQQAVALVQRVGAPNLGIAVDFLHLTRTGGTAADIRGVPPNLIHYAQLCDSASAEVTADYYDEALHGRLVPGAGCFPVLELLKALPVGAALDVEVPTLAAAEAGISGLDRARTAVDASRALVKAASR